MSRSASTSPIPRAIFYVFLLAVPLTSVWNLAVAQFHARWAINVGTPLAGVVYQTPMIFSWASFRDGILQNAIAGRVAEALLVRPFLIRLNNELRLDLFGLLPPQVIRGDDGELIQPHYLEAYCSITNGMGGRLASENIPKLKEIQEFYRARGGIFIELITPSKVAQMPEAFINRFPCENSPDARVQFLPQYVESLREAGINVVDAAGLIHSLKGRDPVGLFPQGGVHWNELAAARAVSVLVEEINRRAATKLIPSFDFTYDVSPVAGGMDQDLAELLNVFFPPLNYSTPKVKFVRSASCPDSPSLAIEVAVVGDSFSHRVSRILIEQNCLYGLNFYYYWHALFGGFPYRKIREGLVRADISRLRDAKIMIFEENESFLGRADLESLRKTLIH